MSFKPDPQKKRERVLVAMGGGKASAVAAAVLKRQGFDVTAFFLRLVDSKSPWATACARRGSLDNVESLGRKLGLKVLEFDATGLFEAAVVDFSVHELLGLRVPDACVESTRRVLFDELFRKADELGIERVATGHFAQVFENPQAKTHALGRASDPQMDQSYFLYRLRPEELRRLILPVGGFTASMIEKLARELDVQVGGVPLSVSASDHVADENEAFFRQLVDSRVDLQLRPAGEIKTLDGMVVGQHGGLYRHSIGQKISGIRNIEATPYVVALDLNQYAVILGPESKLMEQEFVANQGTWLRPVHGLRGTRLLARLAPLGPLEPCSVTLFENDSVHVRFEAPHRALRPGTSVVFYEGNEVLGGARILATGPLP